MTIKTITAQNIPPTQLAALLDLTATFEPGELRTALEAFVIGIANGRDQAIAIGLTP